MVHVKYRQCKYLFNDSYALKRTKEKTKDKLHM